MGRVCSMRNQSEAIFLSNNSPVVGFGIWLNTQGEVR
jgi:hypothetical protein